MSASVLGRSQAGRDEAAVVASPLDLDRARRAGAGEPAAQAWLVMELLPSVRRIARAFLQSPADADDVAQLALLAILRSAATYRGEASLATWGRRIAVRTALKYVRAGRQREALIAGDESAADDVPASSPGRDAEALPRHVREYLDELPEAQREVIILHVALEHTVDEVAEMTEASRDTVKSRLRLGIEALRKQVRQDIAVGRRRSA
ncbi:RNA polymerase sigma factor [Polyangium sp. 15x6]|uniref:RNA polymerase sigma factor n=1 Tax=Polyangium sp. 15x6 TaxID=3042687 RepID=UPI00249A31A0|nr:RNA polymerase sigma factor [Polyangium sp. 15x6]MDI3288198.1 RNA polymerase sigma factor [Polyangium sp. 15x6]